MIRNRIKTLIFSLFTAAQLWVNGPALATGTTPLSLVQQFDSSGAPLAGCLLYFFVAGTVATPQNAYADFGLTSALPNPVTCDQTGRVPLHWLADGLIHIRLTDSTGVVYVDATMQVLGPSSGGGGGGGTVDPTTILATGDEKLRYGTGPLSGFVRENGLNIGNASSGATERANADTQNLFVYLWNTDPNLTVSGGRGANALADFNASKAITLPDMRGRVPAALADMGNTASSVLPSSYCSSPTTLGFSCGSASATLAVTNLPTISSSMSGSATPSGQVVPAANGTVTAFAAAPGSSAEVPNNAGGAWGNLTSLTVTGTATSTGTNNTAFGIVMPIMLRTYYIKL